MLLAKNVKSNSNIVPLPTQKENPNKKKVLKKTVIKVPNLLIIAGVLFLAYSFGVQHFKMQSLQKDVNKINSQMAEFSLNNAQLKKEINRMKSDLYVERMAREKLGLIKSGETPIMEAKVVEGQIMEKSENKEVH